MIYKNILSNTTRYCYYYCHFLCPALLLLRIPLRYFCYLTDSNLLLSLFFATASVLSVGCTFQCVSISYLFFIVILRKTVWTKKQYMGVTNGVCKKFGFNHWPKRRDNLITQFKNYGITILTETIISIPFANMA